MKVSKTTVANKSTQANVPFVRQMQRDIVKYKQQGLKLSAEVHDLQSHLKCLKTVGATVLSIENVKCDDKLLKCYTAIHKYAILDYLMAYIRPLMKGTKV